MPAKYKIMISILVALAAAATFFFQSGSGQQITPWVALGLGGFMIFPIWLFPETRKDK